MYRPNEEKINRTIAQYKADEGIKVLGAEELELFNIFSGKELYYIYPNGDEVFNVDIVFIYKKYTGTLKAEPNQVEVLQFFNIEELPTPISPPLVKVLDAYISARKNKR